METAEKIVTPGKSHKVLNAQNRVNKISIIVNDGNRNSRHDIVYPQNCHITVKDMYQKGFSDVISFPHYGGIMQKVTVSATTQKRDGCHKVGQFYFSLTYKGTDKEYPAKVTRFNFYTQK